MFNVLQRFNTNLEALALEVTGLRTVVDVQSRQIAELQADQALREALEPSVRGPRLARPIRLSLDSTAMIAPCATPGDDASIAPPISLTATRRRGPF
jgi:hypothetical protein